MGEAPRTPLVGIPAKRGASPPQNPNQVQALHNNVGAERRKLVHTMATRHMRPLLLLATLIHLQLSASQLEAFLPPLTAAVTAAGGRRDRRRPLSPLRSHFARRVRRGVPGRQRVAFDEL